MAKNTIRRVFALLQPRAVVAGWRGSPKSNGQSSCSQIAKGWGYTGIPGIPHVQTNPFSHGPLVTSCNLPRLVGDFVPTLAAVTA